MDNRDFWIGTTLFFSFVLLLLGSCSYGEYKYGRAVERRLLTQYFVQMTQDTYYDGYRDGYSSGKKAKEKELTDEEDGRY